MAISGTNRLILNKATADKSSKEELAKKLKDANTVAKSIKSISTKNGKK